MTNTIHTLPFLPHVGSGGPTAGVIQTPPLALTRLAAGTVIEGTVIGRPVKGQVSVQTQQGELALRTSASLAPGTKVALQLQPSGGQVRVLVIPGPPAGAAGSTASPSAANPAATSTTPAAAPTAPTAGSPAPAATPAGSGPIGGTPAGGTPIGGAPTGGASVTGAPAGGIPSVTATVSVTAGSAPVTPGTPITASPAAGTPVSGPPVTATPPTATPNPPPTGTSPVVTQSGAQAPAQASATPLGSTTMATPISANPASTAPTPPIPGTVGADVAPLARIMPGFELALEAIARANPQAGRALVQSVIPQPGPQLAGSIALLMNALGAGSIRGWLGENALVDLARARGTKAVTDLADDFQQLSRIARSEIGEWRAYVLPFHDGERMQPIRLYVKPRKRGAGTPDDDSPSRFVFEIELTRLGQMQLDGLATERRFDLMVRSKTPLPPAVRADIRALFSRLRNDHGLTGDVAFQVVRDFSVAPLGDKHALDTGLLA